MDSRAAADGAATPDQLGPLTGGARVASLDFIRGIAVLGILAANIVAFGQPMTAYMYPGAFLTPHGPAEDWMWVGQFVLVDGKMRGLFTLLFGAGIWLFLERAAARGAGRGLQARRLVWLALFGLIHFFFLWQGDILFYYALCGLLALPLVALAARRQLALGLALYLLGALIYGAMTVGMAWAVDTPAAPMAELRASLIEAQASEIAQGERVAALIARGDYAGFVARNFAEDAATPLMMFFFFLLETLPLILIGMAMFRLGLFDGRIDPAKQRRWGWVGVIAGTALTVPIALAARAEGLTYYGTLAAFMGWSMLPRLPVILGLAALLALWAPRATGRLGQRVSAAGRTAFTNYLGTSVLMIAVFHGWGLGLFGELTRGELYLVMLGGWAAMLAWSKPWLERFRYGPLEWLWRCLTYGRLFPLRR
jgi:uncharacterized protein